MNPLISVIIPVYNVEKYLKTCLDSVIGQTYDNLEILVVDDGSTDSSGQICDSYLSLDPRIKVFHKKNGGLSSARNYGIENSNGDYIGFVDSDDYIAPDMYESLVSLIDKYKADMAMCGLYDMFDGKPRMVFDQNEEFEADSAEAIRIVLEAKKVSVTAVNKLYKRELFDSIRYPLGKTAEDAFVIVELLEKCDRIAITTEQKYYYIHRSNSITTNRFSEKTLNTIEAYEKNYKIINERFPQLLDVAKMRLCWAHFYVLDRIVYDDSGRFTEKKEQIVRYLRNNIGFILREKRFTVFRRVSAFILLFSLKLYKLCVDIQNKRYKIT